MKKSWLILPVLFLALTGCGQATDTVSNSTTESNDSTTTETTTTTDNSMTGGITVDEVASHNTEVDCWVIINDKVYDVTSAIATHPGGPQAIIPNCGTDATEVFTTRNKPVASDHSQQAYDSLDQLYVGDLQ